MEPAPVRGVALLVRAVGAFNARTGAFTRPDARNPDHVSDYERMRRMNNMYFDMDAWQNEIDQGQEEEGGKKRMKKLLFKIC